MNGTEKTIRGIIEEVIFQNEENGYAVLRISLADGEVTAVGCVPCAAPGEGCAASGRFISHPVYGEQFKIDVIERSKPTGTRALFAFLSSGAVRGVGEATARNILRAFGEEALIILQHHPERLAALPGMTKRRALRIAAAFQSQMSVRELLDFLSAHNIPSAAAMLLFRRYGTNALEEIKRNPYLLASEEFGAAFSAADALALSLGIPAEDARRVKAALLFELLHNSGNGHAFLPREKLLAAAAQLILVPVDAAAQSLDALLSQGEIFEEEIAGISACYLPVFYDSERYISARVRELCATEIQAPKDLNTRLLQIETDLNVTYAPKQREAILNAAKKRIMLLTGGPGTGKTTSLRGLLALFDRLGLKTALCAPTGRAAKRLGSLCAAEAYTIHRLLETQLDRNLGCLTFGRKKENPLSADAVIVDEASMVDLTLMQALLAALRPGCRLILVGDPDQLPSVGAGNLFSDLICSNLIHTVHLTEIFRQARESGIVQNAHAINRGEHPNLGNNTKDFFFLSRKAPEAVAETIAELCKTRLPEKMGIPADQIQVLTPTRKHQTGTASLNLLLQAALNPPHKKKRERAFGGQTLREGDRVMQIRNNYDLMWREDGGAGAGMGIWNGDIGHIREVDPKNGGVTVDFEGRLVAYTPELLSELELAYAVTVHKSQGSEYRAVIFAALEGAPILLSRNILYTAVTRARELLILVGAREVVARMTENSRYQRRYSGLRFRLSQEP